MVLERGVGVVVLANSNTAPIFSLTKAALDVLLGEDLAEPPKPPVTVPLAKMLEEAGVGPAVELYNQLQAAGDDEFDLGQDGFSEAVWGVIEMHRTDLAWPLLKVWQHPEDDDTTAMLLQVTEVRQPWAW
ncbi:hypothetical protein [uncultured Serinicoccus sp.]|uniref:hypothetical protein n=1 Tax=uncultured Serinicoccus sp. TaxID=735514 RepID=UPI002603048A|nr:hypothetical protein [uncultured Serinicoccus sp.]